MLNHYDALDRWFARSGDLFTVNIAGTELQIIARGKLAAEALNGHRANFVRSPLFNAGVKMLVGDSMLTREGEAWRERRRALQPHFRAKMMRQMVGRISATLDEIIAELEPGCVEVSSLCDRMTMSIILRVLFGHSMSPEVFAELNELGPVLISRVALLWVSSQLPSWIPLPGASRFRAAKAQMDRLILDMVQTRRESGELGDDLLGTLLRMTAEGVLDDEGVRDEALTMLLAGYETTSNTLSWTLHTLATHPEAVERIHAEAREVFGGSGDVRQLAYTLCCFKEGLRLHPAAPWVVRQAVEDTEVGDHTIKAGETVAVSIHLVHRNPADWAEPDLFRPERFATGGAPPGFMPFGVGQMKCVGQHLALIEGQLILAKLAEAFTLEPVRDHRAHKRISTTLSNTDGIYVELRARNESHEPVVNPTTTPR